MRLFIAIQLPKEVQKYLTELQKNFKDAGKITFTKDRHLTLKFLGEVLTTKAQRIQKKLAAIKFQPFRLTLSGIGFFPDEHNARVIWVGLQLNDDLNELHQKIDDTLAQLFDQEKNFVPHLTLGRITSINDKKQFHTLIEHTPTKPLTIPVNNFFLIEIKLGPKGPDHKVIQEYPAVQ